jgi:hypothetical protein
MVLPASTNRGFPATFPFFLTHLALIRSFSHFIHLYILFVAEKSLHEKLNYLLTGI